MNPNNQENNSYNPSYFFHGNHENYFLQPGTYDLRWNMPQNQQARNPNVSNVPASPARVQVFGNQPGTPSPMQRGISTSTPLPGFSSPGMYHSTNGPNVPPGTPSFINTFSGSASPRVMNLQTEGFGSPAPPARSPGNSSAENIHPQTPRPR